MASLKGNILALPDELLLLVSAFLPNKDIKNLRLANWRLKSVSPLRIERVFISPNPKNIEVFRAIASHSEYRKKVEEIIWDDAKFVKIWPDDAYATYDCAHRKDRPERWFHETCDQQLDHTSRDASLVSSVEDLDELEEATAKTEDRNAKGRNPSRYNAMFRQQVTIWRTGQMRKSSQKGLRPLPHCSE